MRIFNRIEKYLLRSIGLQRELPMQIDITNACNLNCCHCYHANHFNQNTLSIDQWQQVIGQYEEIILAMGYSPCILISGGEPLSSPLFLAILGLIKKSEGLLGRPYRLAVLTNGTMTAKLSPLYIATLGTFSNLSFQVSLEGPDPSSHDLIRGQGAFAKALQGIAFLKENGFEVKIGTVLSTSSATGADP